MSSESNIILKVLFDVKETQETIRRFEPMIFRVIDDVHFWIKQNNHIVLSHMGPYKFCHWYEQRFYVNNSSYARVSIWEKGVLTINSYTPKVKLCEVKSSSDECQRIIIEKLKQVVADCEEKTKNNIINPPSDEDTFQYKTDSITKFIHELSEKP